MGYEVRLYNPDSGKEVHRRLGGFTTHYIVTDEDKIQVDLEEAYIQVSFFLIKIIVLKPQCHTNFQVRVLHLFFGAREWSDATSLGKSVSHA